jgi:N-acetylglucosaminyl-diphospho-decaprenol L-rhamnosyltransferase
MIVSIIIVSYNAPKHLELCLDSCQEALRNVEGEIIVVDNNSTEIDFQILKNIFPNVQFLLQNENLGFAKANNLGVAKAKGEYILILNPDTIIPEDLFLPLINFHQSKAQIGFVGVRLIDVNGNFHPESKRNIPTAKNSFSKLFKRLNQSKKNQYYKLEVGEFETAPCEILVGAFMFTTKQIYQEVGGFDPQYFMYGEDIDLSYSTELAGYKNYYKGDITVLHFKGESTNRDQKYFRIFFEAMKIFLSKYYKNNWFNYQFLRLGITCKYWIERIKFNFSDAKFTSENTINLKELYWVEDSKLLDNFQGNKFVFDIEKFTYKEILTLLSRYNSASRSFYLRPKKKNYIIGDNKTVIDIK